MRSFVRCAPFLLVIVVACAGGDGGISSAPAPSSPSAASAPSGTPTVREHLTHLLPRGGESTLSIQTLPNATCLLHGVNEPAGIEHLKLFSDDEGTVRLALRHADPSVEGADLELDCRDDAGSERAHAVDVRVADGAASTPPAPFGRAGKRVLPALDVDPRSLDRDEVLRRGYPPRPDAAVAPAEYTKWLALATSGATVVEPHMVTTPERVHGPIRVITDGAGSSSIWSGFAITSSAATYGEIYGAWTVPQASSQPGFWYLDYSTFWVGMDGFGTPDVVQAGTDQDTQTIFGVQASSYGAWTEWYPLASQSISNFPVNPGDQIETWVWIATASNVWSATGGNGWFLVWNVTQNVQSQIMTAAPSGTMFGGHTAEWVMERPTVNGNVTSLTNYGSAQMTDAWAYDYSYQPHYPTSDTSSQLTMSNGADVLSTVQLVTSRAMTFTWHNYN